MAGVWISFLLLSLALRPFEFSLPRMGTTFRIVLYGTDENTASRAAMAAFERVEQLENVFSDYREESESRRLCRAACESPRQVSEELFSVLQRSLAVSRLSNGAFDVTIGPVVDVWRAARRAKRLPDPEDLAKARAFVGYRNIVLDATDRTVFLKMRNMKLDFGGIAKGYAAAEAISVLKAQGFPFALVDAGGDLALGAPPPGKEGWEIRLGSPGRSPDPPITLRLHDCSVATSGDTYQYLEYDGRRYSHIIDPGSALGTTEAATATVILRDGATADALATALCVLPFDAGQRLIEAIDDASAVLVRRTPGGSLRCLPLRLDRLGTARPSNPPDPAPAARRIE